jgi:hypothetical protein
VARFFENSNEHLGSINAANLLGGCATADFSRWTHLCVD